MTMIIKRPSMMEIMHAIEVLERRKKRRRILTVIGIILLVLALLAVAAAFTVAKPTRYQGYAMDATLKDGELVLVNGLDKQAERGTLVQCALRDPGSKGMMFRRVIGVAGDTVVIDPQTGSVSVNGQPMTEPYVTAPGIGNFDTPAEVKVGEGQLYLMGDNRAESIDSRSSVVGLVSTDAVIGKVWAVLLPAPHRVN